MDDLVTRLNMVDATMNPMTLVIVAREAADRIEQLEEAILQIANLEADPEFGTPPLETAKAIARKVL
jgi:hypothetical protein